MENELETTINGIKAKILEQVTWTIEIEVVKTYTLGTSGWLISKRVDGSSLPKRWWKVQPPKFVTGNRIKVGELEFEVDRN